METFKGRPRALSYPSPPDRSILANIKKPFRHDISRVCECSKNSPQQPDNSNKKAIKIEENKIPIIIDFKN
jgi:hypothetical protein